MRHLPAAEGGLFPIKNVATMSPSAQSSLLQGVRVVSLSINAPGPVAAARLARMGAEVTKVEPPGGDPLKIAAQPWYDSLVRDQTIISLDLKEPAQRRRLDDLLATTDLLLASFRPSALRRLGLDWESLHASHPRVCFAGIIGYPPPNEEKSGHDLTYLADTGLLSPPVMPRSLFVDLAGAQSCVSLALALLVRFFRTGRAECGFVSLSECAHELAEPFAAGLTLPGGPLAGGTPFYSMYASSDGWIAVAALEPHFAQRLASELGVGGRDRLKIEQAFRSQTAKFWEEWAAERDLPLMAIRESKAAADA
jgi:crotonobetainyl-CoA:carnitine CoA-transferase CaiB-like acyl-CoA transferase